MNKHELSAQHAKALELHNKILVSAQLAQNSLWDMCSGLKEMRDGKLYKELGYQNFEDYCGTEFNMSRRNAYRYISIFENYTEKNVTLMSHFGATKLYLLSTLSEAEQAEITAENDVENMTVRELEKEIRELKSDNNRLRNANANITEQLEIAREDYRSVHQEKLELKKQVAHLKDDIDVLEARPIEVAVAEPSDEVRRLEDTIKNLQRVTDEQLDRVQEDHLAAERKLRQEHAAELEQQKKEFEEKLAAAQSAEGDDKQAFKAYYAAAYDTFNRMLEFAKASPNKDFFKDKINKLITSMELSRNTL